MDLNAIPDPRRISVLFSMSIDGSAMFNEDTQLTDAYEELHNLSRTIPER